MIRWMPFFLLLTSVPSHAAEILRIGKDSQSFAVSHDEKRTWQAQDRACVLQRAQEIACGVITKTTSKGAILRIEAPNYDVVAGDKVIGKRGPLAALPAAPADENAQPARKPTAVLMNSVAATEESDVHYFNVTAGAGIGTSFFYPTLSLQAAVTPYLALGISGMFLSSSTAPVTLTAFGGSGVVAFYSQEYFRGLWIQGSAGLTAFTVRGGIQDEDATAFTGSLMIGWRGYWDLGLNIGAAVGVSYFADPGFVTISTAAAGLRPAVTIDVGYNF